MNEMQAVHPCKKGDIKIQVLIPEAMFSFRPAVKSTIRASGSLIPTTGPSGIHLPTQHYSGLNTRK